VKLTAAVVPAACLLALSGVSGSWTAPPAEPVSGCDQSHVVVSYPTEWDSGPGFAVPNAVLTGLSPACAGAEVSVSLYEHADGTTLVASGAVAVPVGATGPLTVPLAPADGQAERVDRLRLVITGGDPPVPAECAHLRFDRILGVVEGTTVLRGTPRRDLLLGGAAGETIDGWANPDCVVGGAGDDVLRGDTGDDVVLGQDGDDLLEGGNGHDRLFGGAGNDVLRDSSDGHGDETGRDLLVGGDGDDVLEGGSGDDVLIGGPGWDRFDGGKGRDVCVAEPGEPVRNCEVVLR
jgi:hypothetical protein